MKSDRRILITEVTGNQGGAVARALQGSGFRLRGLTRKPESEQAAALARHGVEHFVCTSVGSAHKRTGIPHFDNKWRTEETVRGLRFPSHVILRPVFFNDGGPSVFQGDCIFQKETSMASKAKTIDRTGPGKPATVEERAGLPHSTREQEIRIRAYEIYLQRGGQPDHELEDWLQAERELTS